MFQYKTTLSAIREKIAKIQTDALTTQECHVEHHSFIGTSPQGGCEVYACYQPENYVEEYLAGEEQWMRHCNRLIEDILAFPEGYTEAHRTGDDHFNVLVYEFFTNTMDDFHAFQLVCADGLHASTFVAEIRNTSMDEIIRRNLTDHHAHFRMFGFRNRAEMVQFDLTFRGLSTNEIFLRHQS